MRDDLSALKRHSMETNRDIDYNGVRVLAPDSYKLDFHNLSHSMETQAPLNLSSGNHPILNFFPLNAPFVSALYLCFS